MSSPSDSPALPATIETIDTEILVVGAGPAGIASALTASQAGARVTLVDEAAEAGGHLVWEVPDIDEPPLTPMPLWRSSVAEAAAAELDGTNIDYRPNTATWGIFPGGPQRFTVGAYDAANDRGISITARAVIVATGTRDRAWPVRGWELDGFFTERRLLQTLHRDIPPFGTRYALIGDGKATDQVKAAIAVTGGTIVFDSVDINHLRIEGNGRVERIVDRGGPVDVDAVVMAFGQRIDPTLAVQAGAAHTLHIGEAVPTPFTTSDGATTIPGLFVVGEAAGVQGARWAYQHGERVGAAAVRGVPAHEPPAGIWIDPDRPRRPFFPPPRDREIVVDREEGVTLGEIQDAIEAGAYDINDIRRVTRVGMGESQGAESLPVVATLLLWRDSTIADERLLARPRPPIRPIPFHAFLPDLTGAVATH
ncbi:MAG: FAD-dependent oxidoreductase [Thermomicrobiales bacterium]